MIHIGQNPYIVRTVEVGRYASQLPIRQLGGVASLGGWGRGAFLWRRGILVTALFRGELRIRPGSRGVAQGLAGPVAGVPEPENFAGGGRQVDGQLLSDLPLLLHDFFNFLEEGLRGAGDPRGLLATRQGGGGLGATK